MNNTKHRSPFAIAARLIVLVRPMLPIMLAAIVMGVIGHFCATFITVFGGFALLTAAGLPSPLAGVGTAFACILVFALLRGVLRYAEQASNHYIAFKLLALIRDKVFGALRRLTPAKLEGRDRGDLISPDHRRHRAAGGVLCPHHFAGLYRDPLCDRHDLLYGQLSYSARTGAAGRLSAGGHCSAGVVCQTGRQSRPRSTGRPWPTPTAICWKACAACGISCSTRTPPRVPRASRPTARRWGEAEGHEVPRGRDRGCRQHPHRTDGAGCAGGEHPAVSERPAGCGGVLICTLSALSSFGPVVALANLGASLTQVFASADRVLDLLDEDPVTADVTDGADTVFTGAQAEHVSFAYAKEEVLHDLSLTIPEKKIVGITGRSGSGKSTFLRLLMRFWDVSSGTIRFGERDIRTVNTAALRARKVL